MTSHNYPYIRDYPFLYFYRPNHWKICSPLYKINACYFFLPLKALRKEIKQQSKQTMRIGHVKRQKTWNSCQYTSSSFFFSFFFFFFTKREEQLLLFFPFVIEARINNLGSYQLKPLSTLSCKTTTSTTTWIVCAYACNLTDVGMYEHSFFILCIPSMLEFNLILAQIPLT